MKKKIISRLGLVVLGGVIAISGFNMVKGENRTQALTAWMTYWDMDTALEEQYLIAESLMSTQLFAAYFREEDELYVPAQITEAKQGLEGEEVYLTIVNDYETSEGDFILKDSSLVSRLIGDEAVRKKHIQDLVELCISGHYTGLEIDYEKVEKEELEAFYSFCKELNEALKQEGKKLRIITEVYSGMEWNRLPQGPEYVVMAYNLYGLHSGPGPKATETLFKKIKEDWKATELEPTIALATGGFSWASTGEIIQVSEKEAVSIQKQYQIKSKRDPESQAVYFTYKDNKEVKYEVWYADATTLEYWIRLNKELGFSKIAIWRLGQHETSTLQVMMEAGKEGKDEKR